MQYPIVGTFGPGDDRNDPDAGLVSGSVLSALSVEFAYFVDGREIELAKVARFWGREAVTVVDILPRSVPIRVEVKGIVYHFDATATVVDAARVVLLEITDLSAAIDAYVEMFEYPLSLILDRESAADGTAILAAILESELPELLGITIKLEAQGKEPSQLSSVELQQVAKSFRGVADSPRKAADAVMWASHSRLQGLSGAVWVSGDDGQEIRDALIGLFQDLGIGDINLGPEIRGSWFQRFNARLHAFMSQPDMMKIAEEAKRRLDVELVEFRHAELDALRVDMTAKLLAALEKQREAVAIIGTLVVVKFNDQVVIRIVDALMASRIEGNNKLLSNPRAVLQILDGDLEISSIPRDNPPGEIDWR